MMHAVHQNSLQFDVMLCNTAISICETGRRWRDAVYVFESMEKMSFDLDVVTITSAMSACERSGQWQLALALFQEIQKRRLEPNGLTCRTLISACSEHTQWALRLLQDMAKQGMEGVVITFNDAISQFGQTARWRQALMCSDTLTFHGLQLDGVTYISRTSALARADRWQDCLEQVKTLRDCKLEVDFETKASNAALSACSGHLWPYAVALFAELDRQRLCSASSYASLMTLCEHSGQWKISLSLLSVLADAGSPWHATIPWQHSCAQGSRISMEMCQLFSSSTASSSCCCSSAVPLLGCGGGATAASAAANNYCTPTYYAFAAADCQRCDHHLHGHRHV